MYRYIKRQKQTHEDILQTKDKRNMEVPPWNGQWQCYCGVVCYIDIFGPSHFYRFFKYLKVTLIFLISTLEWSVTMLLWCCVLYCYIWPLPLLQVFQISEGKTNISYFYMVTSRVIVCCQNFWLYFAKYRHLTILCLHCSSVLPTEYIFNISPWEIIEVSVTVFADNVNTCQYNFFFSTEYYILIA